ncbi:Uncharacterised protein [uncultured archaeon]|nr:Uncharacterised protein [uncultured archaeon]
MFGKAQSPNPKLVVELSHQDRLLLHALRREMMAFADSMAKLQADIAKLIAENGPTAVAAAVAAKDAADAAAVDAVDATVVAALAPAPTV